MERSFFLKKRRADFVAGGLSGRVIVAGGLGMHLNCAVLWLWDLVGPWHCTGGTDGTDSRHTSC